MYSKCDFLLSSWEQRRSRVSLYWVATTMGVRPSVTAKLPVLRPWFWNLILLNLAAFSYYFIASLGGRVRCKHPFIGRCKSVKLPVCPPPAGCICSNSGVTLEQFAQRASETGEHFFSPRVRPMSHCGSVLT